MSPKGQITIPVDVRRKLGLSPKDPVTIVMEDDVIRIESPLAHLRASAGIAGRLPHPMSWNEMRAAVRDDRAEAYLEKLRRDAAEGEGAIDERDVTVVE